MKKVILSFMTIALAAGSALAQFTTKDVFTKDEIVWYGIDFSKAKLIGQFAEGMGIGGEKKGNELKTKFIPAVNMAVVNSPKKYPLKEAMDKASVYFDIKAVEESNSKIDADGLQSMNPSKLAKEDAEKVVASYSVGDKKEGIAMVMVVENYDKTNKVGTYWVVFFDIKTKSILFSEHVEGKPGLGNLNEYWAGTAAHVIKDMQKETWSQWKRKYK